MKLPFGAAHAFTLLIFFTITGSAIARETTTLAYSDCKQWLEVSSLPISDPRSGLKTSRLFWALGYVTAANVYLQTDRDLLNHMNGSTVGAWVDDYCKKNPKDSLSDALDALILKLIKLK